MQKSRFTDEQIIGGVRVGCRGEVVDIVRKHGVTEQTLYRWKKKYGGMQASEAKRLKALEEENR